MPGRVLAVSPMPPEKSAYALARYSRSPDSIEKSIEWVRNHDSGRFLESFYFDYGHASIADLGHLVLCFEGISELAAIEVEDEQLWDGQARSSRYQDFSKAGFVLPPEFNDSEAALYRKTGALLLEAYRRIHERMREYLSELHPRPAEMKPEAYARNIAARAFDVARYLLPLGIPTGVGQVTSIRTLERQIRRMKASEYAEVRDLAGEIATACAQEPSCKWDESGSREPLAPTLAKYLDRDEHLHQSRLDLAEWARQNLPDPGAAAPHEAVSLSRSPDTLTDIAATLLYPLTHFSYRQLAETLGAWSPARRREIVDVALRSRTKRDELLREFRSSPYIFDLVIDIGAYRDLHRHRRCQQFRQAFGPSLGYSTPPSIAAAGLGPEYSGAVEAAYECFRQLPVPGAAYALPFGTHGRFLFKMDFAQAEYVCKLRSGVKGHFSYREIAWKMKEKLAEMEPDLATVLHATPPWIEDPLMR